MAKEKADLPTLTIYAWIGVCLLWIQHAESALQTAVATVLDDPAIRLEEQNEVEKRETLGLLLKKLKKRVKLDPRIRERLYEFLKKRNQFVHNASEVPGWDLKTEEGREAALQFVVELTFAALSITGLGVALFQVRSKDYFGKEFFDADTLEALRSERLRELLKVFEDRFGPDARKMLAMRSRKAP